MSAGARSLGALAAPVVLAGLVLLPSLGVGFLWDDYQLLLWNERVHQLEHVGTAWTEAFTESSIHSPSAKPYYRPVVKSAFVLQWAAFGEAPLGYHLVSLLLHMTCAGLVALWLSRRLHRTGARGQPLGWGTMAGAVLFAVHPSRTESVAWISGSTDLWMCLWGLAGLLLWEASGGRRWRRVLAGVCFVLALFSKETALALPVLLLVDALLLAPAGERWPRVRPVLALGLVLALALAVRLALVPVSGAGLELGGAEATVLRVGASLGMYLVRTVWPWPPSFLSGALPLGPSGEFILPPALWALGLGAAAVLGAGMLAALRHPPLRPVLADTMYFLVPLLPVMNLVPMQMVVLTSDRFLYLPLLGVASLGGRLVVGLAGRPAAGRLGLLASLGALLVSYGATVSWHVGRVLTDERLWAYEAQVHPDNLFVLQSRYRTLARERGARHALPLAREYLRRVTGTAAEVDTTLHYVSLTLAATSDEEQSVLLAVRAFLDAVADPTRPAARLQLDDVDITLRLDVTRRQRLMGQEAAGLTVMRAKAHARTGNLVEAERLLRELTVREPHHEEGWRSLVLCLAWQRRWEDALVTLAQAQGQLPGVRWSEELRAEIEPGHRSGPVGDAAARGAEEAQRLAGLGAPRLARQLLAPLQARYPQDLRLLHAEVQSYISERRFDRALETLSLAMGRFPQHAQELREAHAEVRAAELEMAREEHAAGE